MFCSLPERMSVAFIQQIPDEEYYILVDSYAAKIQNTPIDTG